MSDGASGRPGKSDQGGAGMDGMRHIHECCAASVTMPCGRCLQAHLVTSLRATTPPPRCAGLPGPCKWSWSGGPRRPLKGVVQRFKERHPLGQQRVIVRLGKLQPLDDGAKRRRLRCTEAPVLQIEVMHDRRNACERSVLKAKHRAQCFERAAVALMGDLDAEHVERDAISRHGISVASEAKACLGIDEPLDQPGRGCAIDAGPRTCHPQAAVIRLCRRVGRRRPRNVRPIGMRDV
jgi:hypothetical protein